MSYDPDKFYVLKYRGSEKYAIIHNFKVVWVKRKDVLSDLEPTHYYSIYPGSTLITSTFNSKSRRITGLELIQTKGTHIDLFRIGELFHESL